MKNILFVYRYNRFRSKIAEAYYNSKNPENPSKGAGYFPGIPLSQDIFDCANSFGLELEDKTQGLNHDLIMWSDTIIVIDHADPMNVFEDYINNDGKNVTHWDIPDIQDDSVEKRKSTAKEIMKKIDSELLRA